MELIVVRSIDPSGRMEIRRESYGSHLRRRTSKKRRKDFSPWVPVSLGGTPSTGNVTEAQQECESRPLSSPCAGSDWLSVEHPVSTQ
jgi:hypothetical protein